MTYTYSCTFSYEDLQQKDRSLLNVEGILQIYDEDCSISRDDLLVVFRFPIGDLLDFLEEKVEEYVEGNRIRIPLRSHSSENMEMLSNLTEVADFLSQDHRKDIEVLEDKLSDSNTQLQTFINTTDKVVNGDLRTCLLESSIKVRKGQTRHRSLSLSLSLLDFISVRLNCLKTKDILGVFPRQEQAFHYFDSLSHYDRRRCKLYSFESVLNGQRKFMVASFDIFLKRYFSNDSCLNQHTYEIIREEFPCRPYFDLEFPIAPNLASEDFQKIIEEGNKAVAIWINLVLWKIYELWDISIDTKDVVVLDSSTETKFSKHIIVHIKPKGANEISPKYEYYFDNNRSIAAFTRLIMLDITYEVIVSNFTSSDTDITLCHSDNPANRITEYQEHYRKPRSQYLNLWFEDNEGNRAFIVDLGVYSKNRMFRILNSSKQGKNAVLSIQPSDAVYYNSLNEYVESESYENVRKRKLDDSFVICHNILKSFDHVLHHSHRQSSGFNNMVNNSETLLHGQSQNVSNPEPCTKNDDIGMSRIHYHFRSRYILSMKNQNNIENEHLNLSREFRMLDQNNVCRGNTFPHLSPSKGLTERHQTNAHAATSNINWRDCIIMESNRRGNPSPFPKIDDFAVKALACKGGVRGEISGWAFLRYPNTNPPIYRIRYQIINNRFCCNINRPHKSNHIMLEVDFLSAFVTQLCWDPHCRGFRSNPVHIPSAIMPSYDDVISIDKVRIS